MTSFWCFSDYDLNVVSESPGPLITTGPIGSIGPIGPTGPVGMRGQPGPAGATGAQGIPGIPGTEASTCIATLNLQEDVTLATGDELSVPWVTGENPMPTCPTITPLGFEGVQVPSGAKVFISGVLLIDTTSAGVVTVEINDITVATENVDGQATLSFSIALQLGALIDNVKTKVLLDDNAIGSLLVNSNITIYVF